MKLHKITFKQFALKDFKEDDLQYYIQVLSNLTKRNKLHKFTLEEFEMLPFIVVKDLHYFYSNMTVPYIKICSTVSGYKEDKIMDMKLTNVFHFYNYLEAGIQRTMKAEQNALDYQPEGKELQAGIERLFKFGVFGTIDNLAGGDITKHDIVKEMPYQIVFTKLHLDKETSEFQKAYNKILFK